MFDRLGCSIRIVLFDQWPFSSVLTTIVDISISIEDDTSTIEFSIQITFSPNYYI
ncbi:hypothetical protein HanPI659440_Chr15g0616451 [Helianthus annuus]|nr:hypothetical protein HanPI659440_Chr15g0616451 [Helianthus annuus]